MRKLVIIGLVLATIGAGAGAYYNLRRGQPAPQIITAAVTRGSIVDAINATGALEAVTTVQVGTQVSGTIQQLYADFNSIVRRGQVIARLDPSLFETQVEQARANLVRAQAEVERLRVAVEDAASRLVRAEGLADRNLIPTSELETAQVTLRSAQAQQRSAQAQMTQAQAALNQAEVNLRHTVIEAPIDGIVVSRNVDVGQTVAASMQAPTLYVLAADLTKMKVNASVDEADIGRIRPGQAARFRVDAYPGDEFRGRVAQVRLQPIVVQNVVTYATVIDVPNPDLRLKPGMTATVTIEIARRDDAIRVPNAAVRFRPTADTFFALGQAPPGDATARPDVAGPMPAPPDRPAASGPAPAEAAGPMADALRRQPGSAPGQPAERPFADGGFDPERRRRLEERLAQMSPEERERLRARTGGRTPGDAPRTAPPQPPAEGSGDIARRGATTIDALFGPLPPTESRARVWRYIGGELKPLSVRLGVADGTHTELLGGDLEPGLELVTGVLLPESAAAGAGGGRSPLMGPTRRPGGGPPGVRNPAPR